MRPGIPRISMAMALVSIFSVAAWFISPAIAYDRYSVNRDATNCRKCHGQFGGVRYTSKVDGSAWIHPQWGPVSLHDGHQGMLYDGSTYGCKGCHDINVKFPVYIKKSTASPPFNNSCLACHGRVEGPGGVLTGVGLMQRHYRRGTTVCANCHANANPANYTPVGENVQPPGYFTPDPIHPDKPTDSCNNNGAENRYGSSRGLDLDGDLLDDLADPDCGGAAQGPDTAITGTPPNPSNSASANFTFTSPAPAATFECALDGAGYGGCVSPKGYTGLSDGSHTFSVRAKDAGGVFDPSPAAYTWTVDTAAPDTTLSGTPPNPSGSASASFTFTSPDPAATFECALDGAGYGVCASPKGYTGLSDGNHTFSVRAKDAAGNVDPSPAACTWTVDTAAPDTTLSGTPPNPSGSASASFTFTSPDPAATFECALDGAGYGVCVSPKGYTALSDGNHTFSVRAKDAVGNVDPSPAAHSWTVDTAAPDTALSGAPPDPSGSTSASFTFTSPDPAAAFECALDGAGYGVCVSPKGYTGLSDGNHTFSVRAKDAAGNVDPSPANYAWTITTGPARHELIVSGDGNGDYLSIQAALDAITNAAADNRYRVTVKPGVYDEAVRIKPFVDVIGNGPGNTTITSGNQGATVLLQDASGLADVTVTTRAPGTFPIVRTDANASATMRGVTVQVPDAETGLEVEAGASLELFDSRIVFQDVTAATRHGIRFAGASLLISGCIIEKKAAAADSFVYGISGHSAGKILLVNSIVKLTGGGYGVACVGDVDILRSSISVEGGSNLYPAQVGVLSQGNMNLRNSDVIATGDATGDTCGVIVGGGTSIMEHSTIVGIAPTSPSYGVKILAPAEIDGSSVSGGTAALFKAGSSPDESFRIGASRIGGGHNGTPGTDKVVNCYDETYSPVPGL
jgi:putative hemolysin